MYITLYTNWQADILRTRWPAREAARWATAPCRIELSAK